MKKSFNVWTFIPFLTLLSCGVPDKKMNSVTERKEKTSAQQTSKNRSSMFKNGDVNCNFDKFINDPHTPKLAKELFNNTATYSEEPLTYFYNLESTNISKRAFYFRVVTNSYNVADGAYAEGLGSFGKEFIENHTNEFISFFDHSECFTDEDLETWANIAILEFSLIEEDSLNKSIIDNYIATLNANCITCTAKQKVALTKFSTKLRSKYLEHFQTINDN